jgi:hypothetical protein
VNGIERHGGSIRCLLGRRVDTYRVMLSFRAVLPMALLLALSGCPDNKQKFADAGPETDAAVDAPVDAAVDASAPLPAYEITGGARKVTGARFSADVQIGHGVGQAPASGNGTEIQGNAAVKP